MYLEGLLSGGYTYDIKNPRKEIECKGDPDHVSNKTSNLSLKNGSSYGQPQQCSYTPRKGVFAFSDSNARQSGGNIFQELGGFDCTKVISCVEKMGIRTTTYDTRLDQCHQHSGGRTH